SGESPRAATESGKNLPKVSRAHKEPLDATRLGSQITFSWRVVPRRETSAAPDLIQLTGGSWNESNGKIAQGPHGYGLRRPRLYGHDRRWRRRQHHGTRRQSGQHWRSDQHRPQADAAQTRRDAGPGRGHAPAPADHLRV